jgi:tetracycline 7-halogenase / FADH2 O2-dependent halogenase
LTAEYDIAVVGSGFAGSLMAMIARKLGHSVILLEKGKHPRFAIGESSTPLSNLLLQTISERYDLPLLKPLCKWGTWQRTYPDIACGLKRGFSFFHHDLESPYRALDSYRQLHVAASPNDLIADTHWYRADFDQLLVQQAQSVGVDYFDEVEIRAARSVDGVWHLEATQAAHERTFHVRFLIDATGPRGFLHKVLGLSETPLPDFPLTSALYSHFSGVDELAASHSLRAMESPYPVDASAVHHVFDGGWIWVLRFNNGITSAGVAATHQAAERLSLERKANAWKELLDSLPLVKSQFANARVERPFTFARQLSFRSSAIAGSNWALLPSAAGFVDPLLSTGFPLTLLGISRLGAILDQHWGSPQMETSLQEYSQQTDDELLATARLIGALYGNMGDFPTFRCLSLLYFAAASYSEVARRLNKPALANSFLLQDHPVFGPESRRLLTLAQAPMNATEKRRLSDDVYELIRDFDVAGLGKRPANHSYPVDAADLFGAVAKLGSSPREIEALLQRTGFYSAAHQQQF